MTKEGGGQASGESLVSEMEKEESGWGNMYGWAESNVNVLTSNVLLGAEPGTPNFRGIAVKLAKITDDLCREGGFKVHGNR